MKLLMLATFAFLFTCFASAGGVQEEYSQICEKVMDSKMLAVAKESCNVSTGVSLGSAESIWSDIESSYFDLMSQASSGAKVQVEILWSEARLLYYRLLADGLEENLVRNSGTEVDGQ